MKFIDVDFNVYDQASEAVKSNYLNDFAMRGVNVYNIQKSWKKPSKFDALELINKLDSTQYVYLHTTNIFIKTEHCFMLLSCYDNISLDIFGSIEEVTKIIDIVDENYASLKATASVRWFYNKDMHSVSLPLKHKPTYDSFYPMLNGSRTDYYDKFLESEANILILLGEPGTGKTNFLKDMMNHSATETFLTYNEDLMQNDSFFVQFIQSEARFLVFEDADTYMSARSDGNFMMHRFLNVAEGLVSSKNKKIVFSTNLPSSQRIDEALLRKGRCFDLLTFRRYSEVEAQRICKDLGKPMPLGKQFPITLANLLND